MSDPISLDYVRELEARVACLTEAASRAAAILGEGEPALDIYNIKTGRDGQEEVAQRAAPATARRFTARYNELDAVTKAARAFLDNPGPPEQAALEKTLAVHEKAEARRMKAIQAAAKKGEPWWEVEP